MLDSELAAAHDVNFVATMNLLADAVDGGFTRSLGRIQVAATRLPSAFFNAISITAPLTDAVDDLRKAVDLMRSEALPFVVHVPSDRPADVAAARSLGLVGDDLLPCFAIEPGSIPEPPADLDIVRVDAASSSPFVDVIAAGFGSPREFTDRLLPPRVFEHPGLRAYLGSVAGRPVATAMSVRTNDVVGVYSVATLPEARGHGYGTALTWATLADADPGFRAAVLQASPMGRPVYERMGFRLVREFIELGEA